MKRTGREREEERRWNKLDRGGREGKENARRGQRVKRKEIKSQTGLIDY
jgi:hypothetical protein